METPFIFAIHELNPHGGHERSTLEVLHFCRTRKPEIALYTYSYDDPKPMADMEVFQVWPKIRRPAFVLIIVFLLHSLLRFSWLPKLISGSRPRIMSVGTASAVSDIVLVQFVAAEWLKKINLGEADLEGVGNLRRVYLWLLWNFNTLIEKWLYRDKRKRFIAISENVKRSLIQHHQIPETSIRVIHHGVDAEIFKPNADNRTTVRAELGIEEESLVVLLVGAYDRKGLRTGLQAFAKLPIDLRDSAYFVAIGNGDRARYQAMAQELGIEARVRLLSPRGDVQTLYQAADIFCFPSQYDTFALVVLEAMASKLAVIVSAEAGASELVKDGESGIVLEHPKAVHEWESALERVLGDKELRTSLQENAYQVALDNSWEKVGQRYYQFFQETGNID